jgi:4-amino-4-deoxy-L-arabinose transferase-like glycosyltransferase
VQTNEEVRVEPLPRRVVWAVVLAFCALAWASFATRDFGRHPDEQFQVDMVAHTVETGSLLPDWYRYPSVSFWLSLVSLAPVAFELDFDRARVLEHVRSPEFILAGRAPFILVAYVVLFWVAKLAWNATRSRAATLLAVLLLGACFELHYHSRWMVSDAINSQWVALGTLFACLYLRSGRPVHFVGAAVIAGVATGTKYPGGLVLVPLGFALLLRRPRELGRVALLSGLALAIVVVTFVATTPGAVLEWSSFERDVRREMRHYGERGHGPYSVEPGVEHLSRIFEYLGFSALSFQPVIAACAFAAALVGVVWLARRDPRLAVVLGSLPVVYLFYFATQRVMVVRNLQMLLPFLAVFAACGVHALTLALSRPVARRAVWVVVLVGLAWNVAWLVRADSSILRRGEVDRATEIDAFVRASAKPVWLGKRVLAELGPERAEALRAAGRIANAANEAERVLVYPFDIRLADRSATARFVANRRGTYELLPSGPWEVNFDFYPSWSGDERPFAISSDYYRSLTTKP